MEQKRWNFFLKAISCSVMFSTIYNYNFFLSLLLGAHNNKIRTCKPGLQPSMTYLAYKKEEHILFMHKQWMKHQRSSGTKFVSAVYRLPFSLDTPTGVCTQLALNMGSMGLVFLS